MLKGKKREDKNQSQHTANVEILTNISRLITTLEKTLKQIARKNYNHRSQYPEIFFEIESELNAMQFWIKYYGNFCSVPAFIGLSMIYLEEISLLINQLIILCNPVKGRKRQKKKTLLKQYEKFQKSIGGMLKHIKKYLGALKSGERQIGIAIEAALFKAFEKHCSDIHAKNEGLSVSMRGDKTYVFAWRDKEDYLALINDTKRFRSEVVDKLGAYAHATGHKPLCQSKKKYMLRGFRSKSRKVVMEGGKQETFPIRVIECASCGQKFSVLPSFLPREKHFGIDMIGNIVRGVVLSGHSIRDSYETFKLTGGKLKSCQTIINWLQWFGTHHPATLLTRAGVKGSGYLQEDEGFEKEPHLRTYTVVMAEPETLLIWHIDYVDHVDEETLYHSFEKFLDRIKFKIIGVTKDKWGPATDAMKKVFHRLWIGFCHRHCLKKVRMALSKYQQESGCSGKTVKGFYKKLKAILETANSKVSLKIRIESLKDEVCNHPLIRQILNQIIKDGSHYTVCNRRRGIKKTTSVADNFLKNIKRKLRQVQSFRDQGRTWAMFRAMANVRNFMPFWPGAKNAHKSPFMSAAGETFDLPWAQVMNVHNAFLFTKNAC